MVKALLDFHRSLNGFIWGWVMIIVLLGVGSYLTVLTRGVQFRKLGFTLREVLGKVFQRGRGEGTVSPFQAVATALASTVGVGNIAGVATALFLGGPGALFWLLVSGVLGMCTKFSEIAIALRFREPDETGTMRGGAMYVLSRGLGRPRLGAMFAIFGSVSALAAGNMVQANSLSQAVWATFHISTWVSGLVIAVATALVVLGGIRRIAEVTQYLVPLMCGVYLLAGLFVFLTHLAEIPRVVSLVFGSAFSGHAAVGGFGGALFRDAIRYGLARGLFSNEAGMGSAPMVHATAVTDHPIRQAVYGIFEVFVDTILVCTVTGFVILVTGEWQSGLTGSALSAKAFETALPGAWGDVVITFAVLTFAYSTLIGQAFYGETAAAYLGGARVIMPYRIVWVILAFLGAVASLPLVWDLADTVMAFMALPNLVAVLGCSRLIRRMQGEFFLRNGTGP